jgi:short-subunit dehydrogenase
MSSRLLGKQETKESAAVHSKLVDHSNGTPGSSLQKNRVASIASCCLNSTRVFSAIFRQDQRALQIASSVAGFEPGPLLAVYHASKAFILSWSEALAIELEDTAISVTALCPGPTDTVFFPKAGITGTCAFQGKPQCSSGGQEDAAEYSLNLHKGT